MSSEASNRTRTETDGAVFTQAVILAGGLGTRISEETHLKPKPMVEIGGRPILWHILKIYSSFGINDFIVCAGYKGYVIKEYFANYFLHMSDITFDMTKNTMEVHTRNAEPWRVTVVDTGEETMTGGRLARVKPYLREQAFCFTYGDGVSDIDIKKLMAFHKESGRLATLTAVQPPGRYGALGFDTKAPEKVTSFQEKPEGDGAWINGGFFVLEPEAIDYIENGDQTVWEREPLTQLARDGELSAFRHSGFWKPMDTLRDRVELERLWNSGNAPWKVWN
jgi:glucose-1-phosphate cytidylyltransferase